MTGRPALMCNPSHKGLPPASRAERDDSASPERPAAEAEMTRVLKTGPLRMVSDSRSGTIAYWKHGPLHDVVAPMADHVIMTHPVGSQLMERRTGKSAAIGTARPGVVTIIPAGSTSRWDIRRPMDIVTLYLPQSTLLRIADEANTANPGDLLERTGHPDAITSRLLVSAVDSLDGSAALDTLFRHQLTDLLATRLLVAHAGVATTVQPIIGGWHRQSCAGRSSACVRTAMRTSRSRRLRPMPACRVSTSVAPLRRAPDSRRMPGCASTGSSRP